jgi:xanthine dehydrogenase YagS FAD-binding subunit
MVLNRFAYAQARSLEDATAILDQGCRPLAGGTDLLSMMKSRLMAPEKLVNLKTIPNLNQVHRTPDGWHIGSLATLSQLMERTQVKSESGLAGLYQALLQTATPQIRHMATIGGNLLQRPRCWYYRNELTHCLRKGGKRCFAYRGENKYHAILGGGPCYIVHPSDPAVALLALDASVEIVGPAGRRAGSLAEFFLLPKDDAHREADLTPKELVAAIRFANPAAGARSIYLKAAERAAWDFCLVSVALQLTFENDCVTKARVALGGVAPVPWRAIEAERVLEQRPLTTASIAEAAEASVQGARPLEDNAYKVELVQGLVKEALEYLAG